MVESCARRGRFVAFLSIALAGVSLSSAARATDPGTIFYQPQDTPENVNGFSFGGTTLTALPPLLAPIFSSVQSRWAAGDVDGDGAPDIVTLDNGVLDFHRFDAATGTYTDVQGPQISLFLDGRMFMGDVDGDGGDEILVLGFSQDTPAPRPDAGGRANLDIFHVNSLNPLSLTHTTIPNQYSTLYTTVAAGDIDLDGRAEVLILTQDESTLTALKEPAGNSTLYACSPVLGGSTCTKVAQITIAPNAAGRAPRSLAVSDLDADRAREVLVGYSTCCETSDSGRVAFLRRNGTTFDDAGKQDIGVPFQRLAAGGLDTDPRDDVVFTVGGQQGTAGTVQVFRLNDAKTSLALRASAPAPLSTQTADGKEPPANVFVAEQPLACSDSDTKGCLVNIMAVPLCWSGDQASFEAAVNTQRQFLVDSASLGTCGGRVRFKTLPVQSPGHALADLCTTCTALGSATSCSDCMLNGVRDAVVTDGLATAAELLSFDLVAGIVEQSPCEPLEGQTDGSSKFWASTQVTLTPEEIALGLEAHPENPTTHEWGHTRGLGEEYCSVAAGASSARTVCSGSGPPNHLDASLNCDETQTSCCSADYRDVSLPASDPSKPCFDPSGPVRCCRGNENDEGGRCVMSHATAAGPRAFCDLCKQAIRFSGISCSERYDHGSKVVWGPTFRITKDARIAIVGSASGPGPLGQRREGGPYELQFTDSSNQLLFSRRFDMADGTRDFAPSGFVPDETIVGVRVPEPPAITAGQTVKVTSLLNGVPKAQTTLNGHAPIANAGPAGTFECTGAMAGQFVLDGSGSSDPDGDSLHYAWSGGFADLTNPDSPAPTGTAPLGTTTITLIVSDGVLESQPATTTVTVRDTVRPTIDAPPVAERVVCSDQQTVTLEAPHATDTCWSNVKVDGVVISQNGQTLNPPRTIPSGGIVLPSGEHVVQWTASDGSGNTSQATQTVRIRPAIQATRKLIVHSDAKAVASSGFALLANSGSVFTNIGIEAAVGGIVSEASVDLEPRSSVNGNIRTHGTVDRDFGATVTGTIEQHVATGLLALPQIAPFTTGTSDVTVNPGGQRTLAPGNYRDIKVRLGGRLTLSDGSYTARSLIVESHGSIVVTSSGVARVSVSNLVQYAGSIDSGALAVLYTGSLAVFLPTAFRGAILAPNADVFVQADYSGELGARTVDVSHDVVLTCKTPEEAGLASTSSSGILCSYAGRTRPTGTAALVALSITLFAAARRRKKSRERR